MKKLNFLGAVALAGAMAFTGSPAHAADPVLYGYQFNDYSNAPRGLFTFTTDGTTQDMLWRDALAYGMDGSFNGKMMLGGWVRNGRLCGYETYFPVPSLDYYRYVERDLTTGEVFVEKTIDTNGNNWGNIFLFATYCPANDRIYGYGFNKGRTGYVFKSAPADNLDQAVAIREVKYRDMPRSLCFNEDLGVLVGITSYTRDGDVVEPVRLVQIDVNTGNVTELYESPLRPDYDVMSGMVWLRDRQAYAWNFYTIYDENDGASGLYLLDPEKKTTTQLRSFSPDYHFSYFVPEKQEMTAAPTAPKNVTGITYQFDSESNEGTFTFTLPSQLNDDQSISGDVKYVIYADNKEITSGNGAAGSVVTTGNITLSKGVHFVRIVPEVNGKSGLSDIISIFVGEDAPEAPENVRLNGTTLSWNPVTKSVNGIPLSSVTYEIIFNDQVIDSTTETTYDASEILNPDGLLSAYSFQVQAVAGNLKSKPILSNTEIVGRSYTVPFTIEPTEAQFAVCTQEDTDGNNVGWTLDKRDYDEHMVLTSGFDKDMQSEDWLFLPRFTAPADGIYNMSMNVALADADYNGGILEVWLGTEPNSEKMTKCLIPAMAQYDYSPLNLSADFIIDGELAKAENLYIGLCVKSEQGTLSPLRFETISVKKSVDNLDGPEAVRNLENKSDKETPMETKVSFILPDRTLDGKTIPATNVISATLRTSSGMSKTVTGAPGETKEVIMDLGAGDFLITVTPSWNGKTGLSANTVAHLGFGLPGVIRNLRAEFDETDTHLTLRWDCPDKDMDGNPSENDTFSYNVYTYDASEEAFVLQVTVPYPLTFATMDMGDENMALTNIDVRIAAVNQIGQSPEDVGISVLVGKPYSLPMNDDLNGSDFKYKPFVHPVFGDYGLADLIWTTPEKASLPQMMWAGCNGDALIGIPTAPGAKSRLNIPKFSTIGFEHATANFTFWTGQDAADINLSAFAYPMNSLEEKVIGTVPSGSGYQTVHIPLPDEMTNDAWVSLFVNVVYPTLSSRFVLCDFSIDNGEGVDGIINEAGVIRGGIGEIVIDGYSDVNALVFTLDGKLVAERTLRGNAEIINVPAGFYVVKIGNCAVKVVVG